MKKREDSAHTPFYEQSVLDREILDSGDGFVLSVDYASSRYEDATIESFRKLFVRIAFLLVYTAADEYITVEQLHGEAEI